jgi:MFS family permease
LGPPGGFSLSAPLSCTRCGYQNQPGYQFCTNCGAPLGVLPGGAAPGTPPPAAPYGVPPAYAPYGTPVNYEGTKQVDRTKTGVFLLLIGTLLTWIPVIGFVGYVLVFVGVILVILGRKAFGPAHSRNVILSVVLFIVGIFVVIAIAVYAAVSNITGVIGPNGTVNITPAFLASVANAGLLGSIAAAFILGIAELLFTYGLQAQTGRILLWAAYGAQVALSIALYLVLSPMYSGVVTQADYNAVQTTQEIYGVVSVISAALFAAADYLAWSRINRREIPAPALVPAGMPPGMPPMPPQAPPTGPAPPINPQ